jgi:hypothetical protein
MPSGPDPKFCLAIGICTINFKPPWHHVPQSDDEANLTSLPHEKHLIFLDVGGRCCLSSGQCVPGQIIF